MQRKEGNTQEFIYSVFCQEQGPDAVSEYGIVCRDSAGKVLETAEAVSTDYAFVAELTDRLNEGQAEVCHFWDILDDALC